MRYAIFIIAAFCAQSAAAQSTMTAEEFDAYTRGKTLYYGNGAAPYGAEIYLPDRRVRWSFLDGQCRDGVWYEENGLICFTYEERPEPQCWSFELGRQGLIARFENDPAVTPLFEANESTQEMLCLGPKVGV
ncbi:hypothetical protein ABMC88_06220 [Sulfitobacter sp. HNIBRBA2951]|uniref:hypothetical protein n=1 Tax=Sulfitobacter aquimarinus TaxID=3158557 RepID=UPI0032DFE3A9